MNNNKKNLLKLTNKKQKNKQKKNKTKKKEKAYLKYGPKTTAVLTMGNRKKRCYRNMLKANMSFGETRI
jgi:hypothetical protein